MAKSIKITTTITPEMLTLFKTYNIKKSMAIRRGLYLILQERKAGIDDEETPYNLKLKISRMAAIIDDLRRRNDGSSHN